MGYLWVQAKGTVAYLELVSGGCWVLFIYYVGVGVGLRWWNCFFFSSFFFLGAGLWQDKKQRA